MASVYQSGSQSQQSIVRRSLYVNNWMSNNGGGRKPWFTNEEMDYSRSNLIALTYAEQSLFILLPATIPEIYANNDNPILRTTFKYYWNLICQTCTKFDGIQDLELELHNPTFKSENIKIPHFTVTKENIDRITLSIPAEYSGYFITSQTGHWMNAIADAKSKVAHYNDWDGDYNNYSHSGSMLYIKPNKTFTRVEWGCLITMMVPLTAQYSIFNADSADAGVPTLQIPFSCSIITCENIKCLELLESALAKYHDFIVRDKSLFGLQSNTKLTVIEDLSVDKIFNIMEHPNL